VIAEDTSHMKGKNENEDNSKLINDGKNDLKSGWFLMGPYIFVVGIQYDVWINHTNTITLQNIDWTFDNIQLLLLKIFEFKHRVITRIITQALIDPENWSYFDLETICNMTSGKGIHFIVSYPIFISNPDATPFYAYITNCNPQ
jgi:hypothetical protein